MNTRNEKKKTAPYVCYAVALGLVLYVLSLPVAATCYDRINFGDVETYSWNGKVTYGSSQAYVIVASPFLPKLSNSYEEKNDSSLKMTRFSSGSGMIARFYSPIVYVVHSVPGGWMVNSLYKGLFGNSIVNYQYAYEF